MLPLECHTVARIRCDEYAVKSQAPRDLHVAEQARFASMRRAAGTLRRSALALIVSARRAASSPLRV
jgi:hypothetical protein